MDVSLGRRGGLAAAILATFIDVVELRDNCTDACGSFARIVPVESLEVRVRVAQVGRICAIEVR